jgi:hypothetical protein
MRQSYTRLYEVEPRGPTCTEIFQYPQHRPGRFSHRRQSAPPARCLWLCRDNQASIIRALSCHPNPSIHVIMTSSAERFLAGQSEEQRTVSSLLQLPNVDAVYDNAAEWGPEPWRRVAEILHIELRRWESTHQRRPRLGHDWRGRWRPQEDHRGAYVS